QEGGRRSVTSLARVPLFASALRSTRTSAAWACALAFFAVHPAAAVAEEDARARAIRESSEGQIRDVKRNPAGAEVVDKLGAKAPIDVRMTDDEGRAVTLASYLAPATGENEGGKPV